VDIRSGNVLLQLLGLGVVSGLNESDVGVMIVSGYSKSALAVLLRYAFSQSGFYVKMLYGKLATYYS
jgi:hypothetical protein